MGKIKVVVVEPMEKPRVEEINNELLDMQLLVEGYIECVHIEPYRENVNSYVIVCNEEGKLNRRKLNRGLYHNNPKEIGEPWDIIAGTFFVATDDWENGEFASLDKSQIEEVIERFEYPEIFAKIEDKIVGIKIKE